MKKLFYILAALALALSLLSCGKKAATADAGASADKAYKIGIVFDVGGKGDKSFNDSAYEGLLLLADKYGGFITADGIDKGKNLELKYLEPKSGGQDREILMRVLAEEGYDLIFGVGFMFSDVLGAVAADFPDTHFGLIDGFIPELTKESNVTCLAFDEHTGSFLIGAVAASMADGAKIGFLGGMDIPLIHKFHAGYMAGAMYADPRYKEDGMILAQYVGKEPSAFADPKAGESISVNMYKQGAEVIYHAAGGSGNGLFKAAKDLDKIAMGVDSDQGLIYASSDVAEEQAYAEHIATSMLKRVDQAVFLTSQAFIDGGGNADGGYRSFGIADKGVDVAVNDFNKDVMDPYKAKLEAWKYKITKGDVEVPDHESKIEEYKKALIDD